MKIWKFISVILHPIVIPTIGVLLYFLVTPIYLESKQKLVVLGLIFIATYLFPLFILVLFKKLKWIDSFKTASIKERKLPVALMVIIFYLLARECNLNSVRFNFTF